MASPRKRTIDDVLRYTEAKQAAGTVRRHYLAWRREQAPPLPERCDNPSCQFHHARSSGTAPLFPWFLITPTETIATIESRTYVFCVPTAMGNFGPAEPPLPT